MPPEKIRNDWQARSKYDKNIVDPKLAAETEIMIDELQQRLLTIERRLDQIGRGVYPDIEVFLSMARDNAAVLRRNLPSLLGIYPASEYPTTVNYATEIFTKLESQVTQLESDFGIQRPNQKPLSTRS